jgi:hypothetical protein
LYLRLFVVAVNFTAMFRDSTTSSTFNSTVSDQLTVIVDDDVDVSDVRFAYATLGSMILTAGMLFVVAYIRGRCRRSSSTASDGDREPAADVKETAIDDRNDASVSDPLNGPKTSAENCDEQRTTVIGSSFLRDRYFIAK